MRVTVFVNAGQSPMGTVLSGPLGALARLAAVRVVEPWRYEGFVGTGAAAPARIPDAAVEEGAAFRPDLVICLGGGLFLDADQRGAFGEGTLFAGVALSDPQGLGASLEIAGEFDRFFTQDPDSIAAYRERGLDVERLDLAVDPGLYFPGPGRIEWDVVFVGKWTPFREELLSELARRFRVQVFTHAGEDRWRIPVSGPLETPEELRLAMCRSRLALEVVRIEEDGGGSRRERRRVTPRIFLSSACGVATVVEDFPRLGEYFVAGGEVAVCEGVAGYVEAVGTLLEDGPRRGRMARAARLRVLRDHTWDRRMASLLRRMGKGAGGFGAAEILRWV